MSGVPNIRMIAEMAGVSIATVSRCLNNGVVKPETYRRVMDAVHEVNYTPNALAKSIFQKTYTTVGLMIPNLTNPFFNELAVAVESSLLEFGYSLFLCNTDDDPAKERKYIELLRSYRVAGIIASRPVLKDEYLRSGLALVSFENRISRTTPSVSTDNFSGGAAAFEKLYMAGGRSMLHLTGPFAFDAVTDRRLGFEAAAKKVNIIPDVIRLEKDFNADMLDIQLLDKIDWRKYDSVFVFNDIAASVVIRHLNRKKVQVPDDIQIVGFDNSYVSELISPSLSTFEQASERLGASLVNTLLMQIKGDTDIQLDIRFKPVWIQRESTRRIQEELRNE